MRPMPSEGMHSTFMVSSSRFRRTTNASVDRTNGKRGGAQLDRPEGIRLRGTFAFAVAGSKRVGLPGFRRGLALCHVGHRRQRMRQERYARWRHRERYAHAGDGHERSAMLTPRHCERYARAVADALGQRLFRFWRAMSRAARGEP